MHASHVVFRFYAQLGDLLPPARRGVAFAHACTGAASVKDVIESLGVPHTEVGFIVVDGVPADFRHLAQPGERISVYPPFRALDLAPFPQLVPPLEPEPRFVLDTHLGTLARYLRMLGFDTVYSNHATDGDLAATSAHEQRILLTRDRGLLKRSVVTHGHLVRSGQPREQLREVTERYSLWSRLHPLQRCLACNTPLHHVTRETVQHHLPPRVRARQHEFQQCPGCQRIYWPGSHHARMLAFITAVHGECVAAGCPR
ncbi:MAG: Mut7-C RNAse domain-containing protein [Myxococcota bacterium]